MKWPWLADEWRVIGQSYTVRGTTFPDAVDDDESTLGECSNSENRINLAASLGDAPALEVWLHEIFHAIEGAAGQDIPHPAIRALSRGLQAVWVDNPEEMLRIAEHMAKRGGGHGTETNG